jgi:hypothetical protein
MFSRPARPLVALCLAAVLGLGLMLAPAAHAAATVKVTFPEPPRFTDAGANQRDVANTTRGLSAHLVALGQRQLAAGDVLTIEILDIDLAGRLESTPRGRVRVTTGRADWPRITLRFKLEGASPLAGQEEVRDMNFQRRGGGMSPSDPLRFERRMLTEWFQARLIDRTPAPPR